MKNYTYGTWRLEASKKGSIGYDLLMDIEEKVEAVTFTTDEGKSITLDCDSLIMLELMEMTSNKTTTMFDEYSNSNIKYYYTLIDDDGFYLGMDGGKTYNWIEASKFDEDGIEKRKMYLKCGYHLKKFKMEEVD